MSRYRVGDVVRVKSGLIPDTQYGRQSFVKSMLIYSGCLVTITDILKDNPNHEWYKIAEDRGEWVWSETMLERHKSNATKRGADMKNTDKKWSFNIVHPAQIDTEEISKCLSYAHPLAFLKDSEGKPIGAVVHDSLLEKARRCRKHVSIMKEWKDILAPVDECGFSNTGTLIYTDDIKVFSRLQQWAKKVKAAKWLCADKRKTTVTVELISA